MVPAVSIAREVMACSPVNGCAHDKDQNFQANSVLRDEWGVPTTLLGFMASARDMLRAKFCFILIPRTSSSPSSEPIKTTSMPLSSTPASVRMGDKGVPVHLALPTALTIQGRPLLPEHSNVKSNSFRCRVLSSWRVKFHGALDQPTDL